MSMKCEHYVDMGEHNKPLCKKRNYRPADCERCPTYVEHLKAENAKLRELADAAKEFVEDAHCEDCPCRRDCDDNNHIFCMNDFSYHAFAAMRELGIGVTE